MSSSDPSGESTSPEAVFQSLYENRYEAVFRYVLRRLWTTQNDVPDVTAEVFAIAWRRRQDIPAVPEDLLWLYAIARRIVSRHFRALKRRERLSLRLKTYAHPPPDTFEIEATDREVVRGAIEGLPSHEREALRLVTWEQLTHAQAARVLSCSEGAVSVRVHRARRRLEALLGQHDDPAPTEEREQ